MSFVTNPTNIEIRPIYTKQTWADGDIITADKINHMEDGIESANKGLVVKFDGNPDDGITSDASYSTIMNALANGANVIGVYRNRILRPTSKNENDTQGIIFSGFQSNGIDRHVSTNTVTYTEITVLNTDNVTINYVSYVLNVEMQE